MKFIRSVLKKGVNKIGYNITRIQKDNAYSETLGGTRKVVNAYYKEHCFKCFYGDYLCESILTGRGWDNNLEEIVDRLTKRYSQGDLIEIGANIGASLIPIANKYPDFHFHCVEPVPEFFALLKENAESFHVENVNLYQQAISSIDGQSIQIHTQLGTAGALPQYDIHTPIGAIDVQTITVDTLFSGKDVKFFKLDVDGFELEILKGARQTLSRFMPVCFIEFHTKIMRKLGVNPKDVTDLMAALGYDLITIYYDGKVIKVTSSYEDVLQIADSVEYYIDILLEKRSETGLL